MDKSDRNLVITLGVGVAGAIAIWLYLQSQNYPALYYPSCEEVANL